MLKEHTQTMNNKIKLHTRYSSRAYEYVRQLANSYSYLTSDIQFTAERLLLLLLLVNVFDDAPVCRHVKDESWARAVTWRTTEMQVSKDEYVMTV